MNLYSLACESNHIGSEMHVKNNELKEVIIYTDGACIGNPGPGGYGVVLQYGKHRKELSDGFRLTTNNRMELMAAIVALETLRTKCKVTLYTDSQLLANSIEEGWIEKWRKKGWKRGKRWVLNADLWKRLGELTKNHELKIIWIKGHTGTLGNERADVLSMQAAQHKSSNIDAAYEEEQTEIKPLSLFSSQRSTGSQDNITIELNGKKYTWNGSSWLGEDFLKPPEVTIRQLNTKLSSRLAQKDEQITDIFLLIERAKNARANLQHQRAEKLAYQILELNPDNHAGLAILCASLRDRGLAERALKETEAYKLTNNPALLTSRAAAYCDLKMWEEAKRSVGKALAIQTSEEAFMVVKRIRSVRPDLYD